MDSALRVWGNFTVKVCWPMFVFSCIALFAVRIVLIVLNLTNIFGKRSFLLEEFILWHMEFVFQQIMSSFFRLGSGINYCDLRILFFSHSLQLNWAPVIRYMLTLQPRETVQQNQIQKKLKVILCLINNAHSWPKLRHTLMSWAQRACSSGSTLTCLSCQVFWRVSYAKEQYVSHNGIAFKRIEVLLTDTGILKKTNYLGNYQVVRQTLQRLWW